MAATFETIGKSKRVSLNSDNWLDVARTEMRDGKEKRTFLSLKRGYVDRTGTERVKCILTLPDDGDAVERVIRALASISK